MVCSATVRDCICDSALYGKSDKGEGCAVQSAVGKNDIYFRGGMIMLSKGKIISNMLAILAELQALENRAEEISYKLNIDLYNMLCYKLKVYAEILDEDLPEEYVEQIEYFVEI